MRKVLTCAFFAIALLAAAGCERENFLSTGSTIRFSARSVSTGTKAEYSGEHYNESGTDYERINWVTDDLIRISCDQASLPADKFADYKVNSVVASTNRFSTGKISLSDPDETGLRWGTGDHVFFAVYPSPAAGGVTTSLESGVAAGTIPAAQPVASVTSDSGNYTAAPSLVKTMMMTSTATWTEAGYNPSSDILLDFQPVTTAIEFTVVNSTGSTLEVASVSLSSESHPLSGKFTCDIASFDCDFVGTVASADKAATIDLSSSSIALAADKTLTFTFLLNPVEDLDDLVFTITDKEGKIRSTKLEKADYSKVTFHKHIKTYVKGVFIPEGALWKVTLQPMLDSWDLTASNLLLDLPAGVFVTNWTTGIVEDIELIDDEGFDFTLEDPAQASISFSNSVFDSDMTIIPISSTKNSEYTSDMDWKWTIKSYKIGSADAVDCNNFIFTDGGLSVTMKDSKLRVQAQKRDAVQKGGHNYWVNSDGRTDDLDWSPEPWTGVTDLSKLNFQDETKSNPINTANTYIVRHAGTYELPLVYGNAIKDGSMNTMSYQPGVDNPTLAGTSNLSTFLNYKDNEITSAFIEEDVDDEITKLQCAIIWQDECTVAEPVVTNLMITKQKTLNIDGEDHLVRYLRFDVPQSNICQNNALIAIYDDANFNYQCDAGEVIWSWHIWVTNDPVMLGEPISYTNTYGSYSMMRQYAIGYIDGASYPGREPVEITIAQENSGSELVITVEQPDVDDPGYCSYYQAGRKDPVCRRGGQHDDCVADCTLNFGTYDHYNMTSGTTLGMTISNPNVAYRFPNDGNYTINTDNFWGRYRNLWNAACYIGEPYEILEHTTVKTIYDPSPAGYKVPTKAAMYSFDLYSGTGTVTPGASISFPTDNVSEPEIVFMYIGRRNSSGVLKDVGSTAFFWTVDFSGTRSVRFCQVNGNTYTAVGTNGSFLTFAVRPVTE